MHYFDFVFVSSFVQLLLLHILTSCFLMKLTLKVSLRTRWQLIRGFKMIQGMADGKQKIVETVEIKVASDGNRKKQGRGRGQSAPSRGRSSRVNDQSRAQVYGSPGSLSNEKLENPSYKV